MSQETELTERVEAYARASKGSLERALLLALDAGFDFMRVVSAMGNDGPVVALTCIGAGWVDKGRITDSGRRELQQGADA